MDFNQIRQKVEEYILLIEVGRKGFAEANSRAASFLIISAILGDFLLDLETEIAKVVTLKEATYAQALSEMADTLDSKSKMTVTEKKKLISKNTDYSSNRQQVEEMKALQNWVVGHIRIFENAHIQYRQMSRNEGN